ncbi:helix-turn-helix domain-containing protein [Desulfonema magnum]|uniref:HigA domain-containing protein n=1 Tax=Desulfonema magnum TaxID=45655 RepID=A0A975BGF0_9BACT|nr:transcriptional regulator [Desulfonema magnum]QTA84595.1 HigA domain-containing protein [Desulfonema magnum]
MNIRPVKNEKDYQEALGEIEKLFDASPDTPEGDRLEVLTTLVEAYEARHYPMPEPDPIEAIKYYMESRGLTSDNLEPYVGGHVNEILERRKPLSLEMIRNLHDGLGIAANVLIRPYELSSSLM